ncbi:unnamed protein product [Vitrella brassicaformis CCMP3155]|uniref:Uncharacterized protein n=1 Tax=Vitrella brassicaformis (strain CCMP3155) TaxID=1169540 RepID=A0A0G4ECX4_VITBC|nr:unnamed protein product [Vitrella brassicaformis CCMP3155]|eukprot:CEL93407.1 unnamed protein product [Vitrella brassicaformis CCMP3155]
MADGDGDDADDVGEEGHSGGGPTEDDNRNGIDSDEQQQQQGGMADEMADEEGSDSESEDGDSDGAGDDMNEDDNEEPDEYSDMFSDSSDAGYEEAGHPVVAATSVTVPDGCVGVNDIEARFPIGTNEATKQLGLGVIGRTITDPRQVTDLIQQEAADPNVIPRLRKKASMLPGRAHSLLCLAIDNLSDNAIPTIRAEIDEGADRVVTMPQWSSDGLQGGVTTALIERGADINVGRTDHDEDPRPICLAIASGNETTFSILVERDDIDLRGATVMKLPCPLRDPPSDYLQLLWSMFQRLIDRDPTLAAEQRFNHNLVHLAATRAGSHYPKSFIYAYLDLITQHGADMTAVDGIGWTPLHYAAESGSPYVADYLCRKLPADQIDRHVLISNHTPLAMAAKQLDLLLQVQEAENYEGAEITEEECRAESDKVKAIIHSLLRIGADINSLPTAREERRRRRQLVLTEYTTVFKEVGPAFMSAVNAALAPHRGLAALLTPRLAVGPQEAPIFGWRIASYLFDMDAAQEAIGEAIGVRHTDMARRLCAAAEHLVRSAVYRASSNREVVGGTADVGGQVVRVPQLQCFVVGGVGGREMELREVVQRAILDEAVKWGLAGEIDNGFNKDVAAVVWGALGCLEKGRDGRVSFRSLQLT